MPHPALRPFVRAIAAMAVAGVAAGCGSSSARHAPVAAEPSSTSSTTSAPSTTTSTIQPPSTATTGASHPAFAYTIATVTAADLPRSWHQGCPVGPSQLRMIHLTYWGFDSKPHSGEIVVASSVTNEVVSIFEKLYNSRFAIYEMVPVDAYGGDDNRAAAADDTSGFNCRYAVTNPPSQSWSVHAYGEAIDVNDVQNPYVDGSTIIPPAGAAYLNRSDVRPGMAEPGGTLVRAFAAAGWAWGGRWNPGTDYQHFSKTGG